MMRRAAGLRDPAARRFAGIAGYSAGVISMFFQQGAKKTEPAAESAGSVEGDELKTPLCFGSLGRGVFLEQLVLHVAGHRLVVGEFHGEGSRAGGQRAQGRGVAVEFR